MLRHAICKCRRVAAPSVLLGLEARAFHNYFLRIFNHYSWRYYVRGRGIRTNSWCLNRSSCLRSFSWKVNRSTCVARDCKNNHPSLNTAYLHPADTYAGNHFMVSFRTHCLYTCFWFNYRHRYFNSTQLANPQRHIHNMHGTSGEWFRMFDFPTQIWVRADCFFTQTSTSWLPRIPRRQSQWLTQSSSVGLPIV